jgi:hypothetical protein
MAYFITVVGFSACGIMYWNFTLYSTAPCHLIPSQGRTRPPRPNPLPFSHLLLSLSPTLSLRQRKQPRNHLDPPPSLLFPLRLSVSITGRCDHQSRECLQVCHPLYYLHQTQVQPLLLEKCVRSAVNEGVSDSGETGTTDQERICRELPEENLVDDDVEGEGGIVDDV